MDQDLSAPTHTLHQVSEINRSLDGSNALLDILRRRKALMALSLLLIYALGFLYYENQPRVYEGKASVLVHRTGDTLAGKGVDAPNNDQNYLPTHIQLILSSGVLTIALNELKANCPADRVLPSLDQLVKGLKVTVQKDTEILEIRYQTQDRAIIVPVLQAVVVSYQDFVNETHRSTSKEILQILAQQREALESELRAKELELSALQEKEGVPASDDGKNESAASLTNLSQALTQARVRRLEVEGRLQALQEAINRDDMVESYLLPSLDRIGRDVVLRKLGLADTKEALQMQEQTINRDLSRDQIDFDRLKTIYGPNHPILRAQEERLRAAETSLQRTKPTTINTAQSQSELQALAVRLQEQDLKDARKVETYLMEQYTKARQMAVEFASRRAPFVVLEAEMARLRNYYDTLINRIRDINVSDDYVAISTRVIEPPQKPAAPVSPNPQRIAFVCSILGLLFGVGVCSLFDWWSPSYRGPNEITRHLGLPVVGHIPQLSKELRDHPFEAITFHASMSVEAEAFRALRTALTLCDEPPQKFTITSALPSDGKTSILTNLAISFAQSGLRTLVIDGDLRRPAVTRIFDRQNATGLSNLLRQAVLTDDLLSSAIYPTPVDGLFVMPAGTNRSDPSERLASDKLEQILCWAESRYDRILCDAPPILAVSDVAILSRVLDGVLFVVRADKSDRQTASRACDMLNHMNCRILGVIVNAVKPNGAYHSKYGFQGHYSSYYRTTTPVDDRQGSPEATSDDSHATVAMTERAA